MSLEVTATCAQPLELRSQQVRDVNVFTTCPENFAPPDEKAVVAPRPAKLKKSKHGALRFPGEKTRPEKAKLSKPSKKNTSEKACSTKKKQELEDTKSKNLIFVCVFFFANFCQRINGLLL